MSRLPPILPSIDPNLLWPLHAAYMARTDLTQTRMLGYTPFNLDAVTTLLLGTLGTRPTIRHRSGVTDEILEFLEDAGLSISEEIHSYEHAEDAERIAERLVSDGKTLFWPYPLRAGRFPDSAHLVEPDLWKRLNSKEHLPRISPDHALAPREVMSISAIGARAEPPCFLKAGGGEATGWGYAVQYCSTQEQIAEAQTIFSSRDIRTVIVEKSLPIETCWCVSLAVTADSTLYLGAAEQLFSAPGRQSGSVVDAEHDLPPGGVDLALEIGEMARALGFLGFCGLDIGRTPDGRLYVFDPNFRFNSSTTQVLLHPAAAARSGLKVSHSFSEKAELAVSELLSRIRGPLLDGWFVPNRIIDRALLPAADGASYCTGFVLGKDRAEAVTRSKVLKTILDA